MKLESVHFQDVGFLNKSLAVTFLLELTEDDMCHLSCNIYFQSSRIRIFTDLKCMGSFFSFKKNILAVHQANSWRDETHFLWSTRSKYIPAISKPGEVRGQEQFSGLEKADDWCVRGDLGLQSDQRPIPFLSLFVTNNAIVQERHPGIKAHSFNHHTWGPG